MTELAVNAETMARLRQIADQKGTTADVLAEQAIRQYLRDEARRAIQHEADVFRAMHADLLATYAGQYVAIYQGKLIDHDADQLALFTRVEKRYPDAPVLITQVLAEPEEVYTFRSPRLENA